jgi:hypothetical protein
MQAALSRLTSLLIVLCAAASQAQPAGELPGSPYAAIAKRNIFDLQPFIPPPIVQPKPIEPPANFQLVGAKEHQGIRSAIISIQQPARPGQPLSTKAHTIREGETAGPITVLEIANVKTGEMEIENNGARMKINFKSHAAKLPAVGIPNLPPGVVAPLPGIPTPLPQAAVAVPQPFTAPPVRNIVTPGTAEPATMNNVVRPMRQWSGAQSGGLGVINSGAPAVPQVSPAPHEQFQYTREAQAIAIEIERKRTENAVHMGLMPPLPPTELNPVTPAPQQ